MTNYYRRFVKGFSVVAASLTALTKKGIIFDFRQKYRKAFKELKERITTALILCIFNLKLEATIETNASDKAVGEYLK